MDLNIKDEHIAFILHKKKNHRKGNADTAAAFKKKFRPKWAGRYERYDWYLIGQELAERLGGLGWDEARPPAK